MSGFQNNFQSPDGGSAGMLRTGITASGRELNLTQLLQPIILFLRSKACYDMMPMSSKVVMLDVDLPVREAFHIAVENDISFATLWDSRKQAMVGMFTVTDFIDVLLHFHNKPNVIQELADHQIRKWREMSRRNRPVTLASVSPEASILAAVAALKQHRIHRLPIIHEGSLLHIITHPAILQYFVKNVAFDSAVFQYSIEELGIGTYKNVITVPSDTTLYNVLTKLSRNSVSAVPVVNQKGEVVDVYSRYDVMYLAQERQYDLNITVEQAMKNRPKIPVFTCTKEESFESILRHLAKSRVHRLVCVDTDMRVTGVVSISDIFSFFLQYATPIVDAIPSTPLGSATASNSNVNTPATPI